MPSEREERYVKNDGPEEEYSKQRHRGMIPESNERQDTKRKNKHVKENADKELERRWKFVRGTGKRRRCHQCASTKHVCRIRSRATRKPLRSAVIDDVIKLVLLI